MMTEGAGPNITPINFNGLWSMIGFSIYMFEGIGILMPCMQACECPEKFDEILVYSVITIIVSQMIYGTIAYIAYGNMELQMIT